MTTNPAIRFQDENEADRIESRLRQYVSRGIWRSVMWRVVPAALIFVLFGSAFLELLKRLLPQNVLQSPLAVFLAATLVLFPVMIYSVRHVLALAISLQMAHLEVLGVLSAAIAERDDATEEHNLRVAIMAVRLALATGLDRSLMPDLFKGAFLHDIGKIGVPDNILLKPGALTPEERRQMEEHVPHGDKILANSAWLRAADRVVHCHHERFDGSGYPDGRKGERIPPEARIFAIVDVFDALMSDRPYKKAMSLNEALAILEGGRSTHFDPNYLDAFESIAQALYLEVICATPEKLKELGLKLIQTYYSLPAPELAHLVLDTDH